MEPAKGHAAEVLRVYEARTLDGGFGHPTYGDLRGPQGWEFLPSGDSYVTRTVKSPGPHWGVVKSRKGYTAILGTLATTANIEKASRLAEETEARREKARDRSQKQREREERRYRQQFADAVLKYLSFSPRHARLAREIADGTAERATLVGSSRVGRTGKLTLGEKAELAARAFIRHRHTGFEDRLFERDMEQSLPEQGLLDPDGHAYRKARAVSHDEVNELLRRHRHAPKYKP